MNTRVDDFRIGHRDDALNLLDEMVSRIEESNAEAIPALRGMDRCIGSEAYYWPRLEALRDAIRRGIA
jgi:hypothetical protein